MGQRLQWGLLAAGYIATEFADGVKGSQTGELLAVGSRSQASADAFGEKYGIARRYGSYEALLADREVQAVYVSTPHPMHAEWAIKAAEAGKHVLVEKPAGMNWPEAMAMIQAARANDVFWMEAFMYRCHPQMAALASLIRDKAIGDVTLIQASFSYYCGAGPEHRCYNPALGGGGILDVGCYPASAARLIAGAAIGKAFDEPCEVKAVARMTATGVDGGSIACVRFPSGIMAELSTGIDMNLHEDQKVTVFGTEGKITVGDPWCPSRFDRHPARILVRRYRDRTTQEVLVDAPKDLYAYEADMVGEHIAARQAPAMTWDDTLGNMRLLDQWRQEIGLGYPCEEHKSATISGRPLAVRKPNNMKYGRIAGLDKPVSRLVFGCDSNNTMADTAILLDDFFERGGNAFDTSHAYGNPNGACERNLGQWIRNRGIRDQVVVIEKGANPPHGTPDGIIREMTEGLERLQMDRVDVWLMHRDNPQVPVGELIDAMNQMRDRGLCTLFGVSNWSLERLQEAQQYALSSGKAFFSAVSNQFSLARLIDNPWPGILCLSCKEPQYLQWLSENRIPLFSWSSQSRGFFTSRASRADRCDAELVRCWYSNDNFRRKERAEELARKKNVLPINIALAYVLHQAPATFPLIGPKQLSETLSSLAALDVELTLQEVQWLNLDL